MILITVQKAKKIGTKQLILWDKLGQNGVKENTGQNEDHGADDDDILGISVTCTTTHLGVGESSDAGSKHHSDNEIHKLIVP